MKHIKKFESACIFEMKHCFKQVLVLCLLFLFYNSLFAQNGNSDSVSIYNAAKQDIRTKYSKTLNIHSDSICCISMYGVIDKWPDYIKKNPAKLQLHPDGIFIQYLYYLAYSIKLPSNIETLYTNNNLYRFKNPIYLRTGDLVFYGLVNSKPEKVALYLQNNMVVYSDANGSLIFAKLSKIIESGTIISAKIIKNEQGTGN